MTRVLVTGATGFVGRHVTAALHAAGHEVHAVTASSDAPRGPWPVHRVNLLDRSAGAAMVRAIRPEAMIHLAWCAKPPDYWTDPANVEWLSASLDLFRVFAESGGTRIVGVGTCAEYDWRLGQCIERTTPLAPRTLYGSAKAACGSVLEAYSEGAGLSAAWARLFFLIGPGDAPTRFIPSLIGNLRSGRTAVCRAGSHLRDYLHVEDAAAALARLLASDVRGPVNIASGVPTRLADLAAETAAQLGRPDLLQVEEGPPGDRLVVASVARLHDEVGWRSVRSLRDAIAETIRHSPAQEVMPR